MSMKRVMILDGICIVLFLFIMIFLFVLPDREQELLMPVFKILQPYRIGAWIMGAGLLVTCMWGRGRAGLILGIIMLFCYLITTFVTLFGLLALTSQWELLWYLHPALILPGCIIALRTRKKKKAEYTER